MELPIEVTVNAITPLSHKNKDWHGDCPIPACGGKKTLTVSPKYQMFHCFKCGHGGKKQAFLDLIEKLSINTDDN
jgi:DNA primase